MDQRGVSPQFAAPTMRTLPNKGPDPISKSKEVSFRSFQEIKLPAKQAKKKWTTESTLLPPRSH